MAIVRPEPISRMVAVIRGSLVTFFYSRHGCEQPLFPLLTWDDRIYMRSHNSSCGSQVVLLPTPGRLCLSSGHKPSLPTMSVDQTRTVISETMTSSFEFDFPQNTPRDPHWRIILCPLNKYPHANFSDWSPYISWKNKLRKLFLKRSKQDCGLGYMHG